MPAVERLAFEINGTTSESWEQDVQEIVVENSLRMPSMCTISLHDGIQPGGTFTYMESSRFVLGAEVKVFVLDSSPEQVVFQGEIVALEPIFEQNGRSSFVVRAYDKMHRLHRGKHIRTFINVTYSDVIQQILGAAGVSIGAIQPRTTVYEFLIQNNQTNMEWLAMVADMLGYQYYMEAGLFHFKPIPPPGASTVSLEWREELRSFRPHITTTHQPSEVMVNGWDQVKKKTIIGRATKGHAVTADLDAVTASGPVTAASKFGKAPSIVVTIPVPDVNTAQHIATGQIQDIGGEFVRADGVALGNAEVKPGHYVEVKGTGNYSGKFFVTSVRHLSRRDGRWETHFSVNGLGPTSLLSVLRGGEQDIYNNRINGVVPALVTNSRDPLNIGRVKVKYPIMAGGDWELESDWVRVAAPGAGKARGLFWIPEVNDEVLVAFEYGDPHRPYIVGSLWNSLDNPPLQNTVAAPNGVTTQRMLQSRTGHIILLDDSDGAAKIQIIDSTAKNEILIDTKQNSIKLTAEKDITLTAKGNITLDAKGKVEIKSGTDTLITATAAFKVNAKSPSEIKSAATLTIDGATVTVKASTNVSITANAVAELKGGAVVVVQGALIKLN
ncbi:VgrG-related protein [bacterium]|nr:VgrG-related protein [bacterium]